MQYHILTMRCIELHNSWRLWVYKQVAGQLSSVLVQREFEDVHSDLEY